MPTDKYKIPVDKLNTVRQHPHWGNVESVIFKQKTAKDHSKLGRPNTNSQPVFANFVTVYLMLLLVEHVKLNSC